MTSFFKGILYTVPIGIVFIDCVGYIARVDGNHQLNRKKNLINSKY